MSNRRSILATEEGNTTPGSSLRRSSRIANSPVPTAAAEAAPPAAVSRRRSSATETTSSTPARIGLLKRPSLSHEISLEKPVTPKRTAARARAASKSPSAEPEDKNAEDVAVGTPVKRGRRSSITKIKEEAAEKPETPSRRRSLRGQSRSPSKDDTPVPTPKPRGRRASITQNLDVIQETDSNTNAAPKAVGRPVRITRRTSIDAVESETKPEEKKPAPRRSIRGRSASIDIPEEPETKTAPELVVITEETETEKKPDDADGVKVIEKKDDATPNLATENDSSTTKADAEVEEVMEVDLDLRVTTDSPPKNDTKPSSPRKSRTPLKSESDSVFKSPVRRSPRLSGSPVAISPEKSSPSPSPLVIGETKDMPEGSAKSSEASPKMDTPKKDLASTETEGDTSNDSKAKTSPRRSFRLSESLNQEISYENKEDKKISSSPRTSLSLRASESDKSPVIPAEVVDDSKENNIVDESLKSRRSTRLSESVNQEAVVSDENKAEKKVSASPRTALGLRVSESDKSPVVSAEVVADSKENNIVDESSKTRRSTRLSESVNQEAVISDENKAEKKVSASPRTALGLRVSESDKSPVVPSELVDGSNENNVVVESLKPRRSTRLTESSNLPVPTDKRKSSSFSETEKELTPATRLSKSFGESNVLNTLNAISASPKKKSDSVKTPKKESLLKHTPEIIDGSDGSFDINLSIPRTNSIDIEDTDKQPSDVGLVLDVSGSSNNSDKENGDKLNVPKSPKAKRVSLSETSTPKLTNSVKMQSFCEPMEVEFSSEVVVATAQVEMKTPVIEVEEVTRKKDLSTSQNESVIEVDNEVEFGSSPVKGMKPLSTNTAQSENEIEEELMSSFVDEVLDVDEEKATDVISEKSVKEPKPIVSSNVEEPTIIESDSDVEQVLTKEEVTSDESKDIASAEANGRSKRRKIDMEENISQKLDAFINAKLKLVEEDSEDDEHDDDYKPKHDLLDDMASEGEEDTPDEDSNEIIDHGESLHSSESEGLVDEDDDYENDSFVTDDEGADLLSGNEYDLEEMEGKKKKIEKSKRKSRIIRVVDSSDEENDDSKQETADVPKISVTGQDGTVAAKVEEVSSKIVVLQDLKISAPKEPNTSVVINKNDNLKSLEAMKDTLNVETLREPKPSVCTPNTSMNESPNRKQKRKTSLTIQDQIKISRHNDGEITDKIAKAVDFFVSSIKDKSGNVSVNVSLDYANNSGSSSRESTPKKPKQIKEGFENFDKVVNELMEISWGAANTSNKSNAKNAEAKLSATSQEDIHDENIEENVKESSKKDRAKTKVAKELKPTVSGLSTQSKKKSKLNASVSEADLVRDLQSKKEKRSSMNKSLDSSAVELESASFPNQLQKKAKKNKKASQPVVDVPEEKESEFEVVPVKKIKLSRSGKQLLHQNNMRVEDEINPVTTKSEIPSRSNVGSNKKAKKMKPSCSNYDCDSWKPSRSNYDCDSWNVEQVQSTKPSRQNMNKVSAQLEELKRKVAPNDFKNQMLLRPDIKRMDSKDILKKKSKSKGSRA